MADIYKVTYEGSYMDWSITVSIDEEKAQQPIKEMVEFWMGWEYKLALDDGDYTKTFLRQLGATALWLVISEDYNVRGLIDYFKSDRAEGWYPLDGSYGIKIVDMDVDQFSIDNEDFSIKKIIKNISPAATNE